jgi:hypothetical protein
MIGVLGPLTISVKLHQLVTHTQKFKKLLFNKINIKVMQKQTK